MAVMGQVICVIVLQRDLTDVMMVVVEVQDEVELRRSAVHEQLSCYGKTANVEPSLLRPP